MTVLRIAHKDRSFDLAPYLAPSVDDNNNSDIQIDAMDHRYSPGKDSERSEKVHHSVTFASVVEELTERQQTIKSPEANKQVRSEAVEALSEAPGLTLVMKMITCLVDQPKTTYVIYSYQVQVVSVTPSVRRSVESVTDDSEPGDARQQSVSTQVAVNEDVEPQANEPVDGAAEIEPTPENLQIYGSEMTLPRYQRSADAPVLTFTQPTPEKDGMGLRSDGK